MQVISVLLGFAALFIVVPYISSNKVIYGIYSVCTSLTIFFSYADLGFLSSATKFAAEYYVRGEHKEEVHIIGFTSFIMVCMFAILAIGIIILGLFPRLLIPELDTNSEQMHVARWLLFTLAFSCPIMIGLRLLRLIFTIRVEDYKFQLITILGNIVRILSIFFFFGAGQYLIVEYYIFYQLVNFVVVAMALLYICKYYGYSLMEFLHSFGFSREIFDKVKYLTGASLIMTLSTILLYELDQIVISNLLGLEAVAIYAVALSVFQLVRTFNSIVFSPYSSRYNHFVGLGDYENLNRFIKKMIVLFAPILIVPILTLSLMAEPFIISWVGEQYRESGELVSYVVLTFLLNFITIPISLYFTSTECNRILIRYNMLVPIVYWLGIIFTMRSMGTISFAIMKFLSPIVMVVPYFILAKIDINKRGLEFLNISALLKSILPTVFIVIAFSSLFGHWMVKEHAIDALLVNIILMVTSSIVSMVVSIPFNVEIKSEISRYYTAIRNSCIRGKKQ